MLSRSAIIVSAFAISLIILGSLIFGPQIYNLLDGSASRSNLSLDLDENTSADMIANNKLVMLEFYYPGCGLCKDMNQTANELFVGLDGQVAYGRINVRKYSQVAKIYDVNRSPTLLIFSRGAVAKRLGAGSSKSDILSALKELNPSLDVSRVRLAGAKNATGANKSADSPNLADLSQDKPSLPINITDDNIDEAILRYPYLVLNAYADWCAPCKSMSAVVTELSEELQGQVAFGMIDVAQNKKIKSKYNITSYPTLLAYRDGKLLNRSIGYRSKLAFVSQIKDCYPDLNLSLVRLPDTKAMQKAEPKVPINIPLSNLGEADPIHPMLITDDTMASATGQYTFLVVVGFAEWCNYCLQMNQTILALSSGLRGEVAFGLLDVSGNNLTKDRYNLTSYPTTIVFRNGSMVRTVKGYQRTSSLLAILKQIEPNLNTSNVALKQAMPAPSSKLRPRLTPEQACSNMTRSDDPILSAYIVSRCPFGLQMQRIMAGIIENIPEASRHLEVRYIGSSLENGSIDSMHGEEEAGENLRQICIREEQTEKYWEYVRCYMKEGRSEECIRSAYINEDSLDLCCSDMSQGPAYAQEDFREADRYGITGSPTLVMGGMIVHESDFATNSTNGRSQEAVKDLLCCGFKSQPDFCEERLDTNRAATMYAE